MTQHNEQYNVREIIREASRNVVLKEIGSADISKAIKLFL